MERAKPDFSGEWILNREASSLSPGADAMQSATLQIDHREPTFRYKGGLVGYAAFTRHCSFFPMSLAVMAAFAKELEEYETARGTIHFPLDRPLPAALVKKMVRARVAEKDAKGR